MSSSQIAKPRLFAFDLDGTLLNSNKELSQTNLTALTEIREAGNLICFASGRIKSSIRQYLDRCTFPVSILSLNGAAVYADAEYNDRKIYDASLNTEFSDFLIDFSEKNQIALNYYYEEELYAVKNEMTTPWLQLYFNQTRSSYNYKSSLNEFIGKSPSKIIFVASRELLDELQLFFSNLWGNSVYICRTWDYYLEFLNPKANKGLGLKAITDFYHISIDDAVTFGDAMNDIPMLQMAGFSIAMQNAPSEVQKEAKHVSAWNNDQDAVAHEWNFIKKSFFAET